MNSFIYLEGGGTGADSNDVDILCREGFRKLLEKCGFGTQRRMPRLIACGGRDAAFDLFKINLKNNGAGNFLGLWIDSEEPLDDLEAAWKHLNARDHWAKPPGATDDQVLFMTTCMESWFVADRQALRQHFHSNLQESALPTLSNLEARKRQDVQEQLKHATRHCSNAYEKGRRSFEILGKLNPSELAKHLPSFVRIRRILSARL